MTKFLLCKAATAGTVMVLPVVVAVVLAVSVRMTLPPVQILRRLHVADGR